jgi:hypothetical protein
VALLFLWFTFADGPVLAQTGRGGEIGGYGGVQLTDGGGMIKVLDAQRMRVIRSEVDKRGNSFGSVLAGYPTNWFGIEMILAFSTSNYFSELTERGRSLSTIEEGLGSLMGNGVVHFARGRIVPFASAGLGFGGSTGCSDVVDSSTDPKASCEKVDLVPNIGAGVKLFVARRMAVRLEARQFLHRVTTFHEQVELVRGEFVGIPEPFSDRVKSIQLNLGITFWR